MGEAGMKPIVIAAALAALAACAAPAEPPPPPTPAPAPAPPATPPPPDPPQPDACGAYQLQHLVGRPRSEIPVAPDPSKHRVACTTCPVTQDYRADRLNFFFDGNTGLIEQVRCG
jgi:hypothetical protein